MNVYKRFLTSVKSYYSERSYNKIKEALRIAIRENEGRTRYNGDPMTYHCVGVAEIVMKEIGLGSNSVASSLLHEVYRMGRIDDALVQKHFGIECVEILQGLNKISAVETKTSPEQLEHFKELIVSYSTNPRIILIKMADRLEVMRSLGDFPADKRAKKSWESMHIYSQLAHKLGLYGIKSELEDLSLSYLHPDEYRHIKTQLEQTASAREDFIGNFIAPISDRLAKESVRFTIKGRTKSIYSIWRKMKKQRISFDEVYDVFAIRIILDCPKEQEKSECWHVYSVVTDFYKPNPERMRDWISIPKSNGYESLHTTVVTSDGRWVEVQIRSERMDEVAERGIAAHWRYKGVSGNTTSDQWLTQLRGLMEGVDLGQDGSSGTENESSHKEIFVFTPNGDLRKLPEGATVLDFAFDIHSNLGCLCVGGRVNHKNVSIREPLKNGDLVEVITLKNQKPKPDWLNIVKTSKARNKIKAFLREEEAKMANLGREELERKLRNWKINLSLDDAINLLYKYYKAKSGLEMYGWLAQEKIAFSDVKEVLTRHVSGEDVLHVREERTEKKEHREVRNEDLLIIDQQLRNVDYKLAKCCNPIYGDEIFGFVSITRGLTIHRSDCSNGASLRERYPYRIIHAVWSGNTNGGAFSAKVGFISEDVIGLEHSIRDILKEMHANLRGISMDYADNKVKGVITLEVSSTGMLDSVVHKLMKVKGMLRTHRIGSRT